MRTVTCLRPALAAVAVGVLLGACGGNSAGGGSSSMPSMTGMAATSSAASSSVNDADATFAQMMIPHHRQAVEMAALATDRAGSSEVKDLAATIRAEQQPEIGIMTGWLRQWGRPAPSAMSGMSGDSMDGMMPDADLTALKKARGAAFDRMFLRMMLDHHRGAIRMARTEQTEGSNPEAKALAGRIIAAQQAEIARMRKMLG